MYLVAGRDVCRATAGAFRGAGCDVALGADIERATALGASATGGAYATGAGAAGTAGAGEVTDVLRSKGRAADKILIKTKIPTSNNSLLVESAMIVCCISRTCSDKNWSCRVRSSSTSPPTALCDPSIISLENTGYVSTYVGASAGAGEASGAGAGRLTDGRGRDIARGVGLGASA